VSKTKPAVALARRSATLATPALIRKRLEVVPKEPMVMTMTMSQLYGNRIKGDPKCTRAVAELMSVMDNAVAKARKRNPTLKTDDAVLASLAMLQEMWDRRMKELRATGREPHQMEKRPQPDQHRRKKNRLTAFLD